MAKEVKTLTPTVCSLEKTISHYESFGWRLYILRGKKMVMAREMNHPAYRHLTYNQTKYEDLADQHNSIVYPEKPKKPSRIRPLICIMHFLLGIIPGIVYVCCKVSKKKKYRRNLVLYNLECKEITKEKGKIVNRMDRVARYSRYRFCR